MMKTDERPNFARFLFKTAFCFVACDGQIDEREIEEIRRIAKSTSYFKEIDVESELEGLIPEVQKEGRRIFKRYIEELLGQKFDYMQELMLLEVALRVIYGDAKIDANEVRFLKLLRSQLRVPTEIILQRFGTVDLLVGSRAWEDVDVGTSNFEAQFRSVECDESVLEQLSGGFREDGPSGEPH